MLRKVYNKDLQDPEQPLLVHRPKDKEMQRVSSITCILLFVCLFPQYVVLELGGSGGSTTGTNTFHF